MDNFNKESGHKIKKDFEGYNVPKGNVTLFKDWLFENYKLRTNILDTNDVYIDATELNPISYKYEISESDIYLHAVEDGLSISKGLINAIIASPNHCEHFNPIIEYMDSLKGTFHGPSQIDLLNRSLIGPDKGDAERYHYLIQKWLVNVLACLYGKGINDVALGLVSDRAGIGKTTFFEEIVPIPLRRYCKTVLKNSSNTIQPELFSTNLLLNLDELVALTAMTENEFKLLTSSKTVSVRTAGSKRNKQALRIASVCFTSNRTAEQGGFIRSSDPGILRRLAVIEVEEIKDYRNEMNVDMLWAEVATLLQGGFDYQWNREDFMKLCDDNRKYIITTNSMRLVRLHLTVPGKHDQEVFKTAREVVQELKRLRKIPSFMTNVDEVTMGQALSASGFKRTMVRSKDYGPRYCYVMRAEDFK